MTVRRCTGDDDCSREPGDDGRCWWHSIDPGLADKPSGVQLSKTAPLPPRTSWSVGALPSWQVLWGDTSRPC